MKFIILFIIRAVVLMSALYGVAFAQSKPSTWLQGIWNGKCERGSKSINAQLVLGYKGSSNSTVGSLNGRPLAALKVDEQIITFIEGAKIFTGTFDSTFNSLNGDLDKGPKGAPCQLQRIVKESDLLCLLGLPNKDSYVWLNSKNGSGGGATFILRANQHLEIQGDRTGELCSNTTDFKPPKCPISVPQKNYACQ